MHLKSKNSFYNLETNDSVSVWQCVYLVHCSELYYEVSGAFAAAADPVHFFYRL